MNAVIEIGRLLRASTAGCIIGCRVDQAHTPGFGSMVRIPVASNGQPDQQIYGLVYDIHVDDDGLVRQLVTANPVRPEVIEDNRINRNVPLEISVLFTGYEDSGAIRHLLPPRPPLTLDAIYLCNPTDLCAFTSAGRFGYFRHILRAADLPVGELLAAHLRETARAQAAQGNPNWVRSATAELITLLRDDYATLMAVLGALADADLGL